MARSKPRSIVATPRVLMLIDEANIHAAIARNENRQINWEELRDFVASRGGRELTRELEACILFVGMPPDFGPHRADRERRARFYRKLQSLGFTIKKREAPSAIRAQRVQRADTCEPELDCRAIARRCSRLNHATCLVRGVVANAEEQHL